MQARGLSNYRSKTLLAESYLLYMSTKRSETGN